MKIGDEIKTAVDQIKQELNPADPDFGQELPTDPSKKEKVKEKVVSKLASAISRLEGLKHKVESL